MVERSASRRPTTRLAGVHVTPYPYGCNARCPSHLPDPALLLRGWASTMRHRRRPSPGPMLRTVAAVVLCVQALPAGVSLGAELAHGVYHFSERLSLEYLLHSHRHGEGGLHGREASPSHVHDHEDRGLATHDPISRSPAAHGHAPRDREASGSLSHDHNRAVDVLLEAAGDGDASEASDIAPRASPDLGVDLHVPSLWAPLTPPIVHPGSGEHRHPAVPLATTLALDPPPPRA